MESENKLVIAVDGHSSCGKSTVARQIATRLNYIYIDSGAMYRCVTLYALQNKLMQDGKINKEGLKAQIQSVDISFQYNSSSGQNETWLNGRCVEKEIRGMEVSDNVSRISELKFVRERLVALQQEMGQSKGIVMDGRDIGTVVFPHADLKIFMTASAEVRAQRRYLELTEKGEVVSLDEILENVKKRDHIDSNRTESPLRQADDALVLDNSNLTREQQMDWVMEKVQVILNR